MTDNTGDCKECGASPLQLHKMGCKLDPVPTWTAVAYEREYDRQ